jgi:hypothetical protein
MTEPTEQDIEKVEVMCASHAAYWAKVKQIRLSNGQLFETEGREYQVAFMHDDAPEKCYMKATGCGVSDAEILECLHGMIHGRYKQGVLYGFPNDGDMMDYSKTRWNPLIQFNRSQIGQYMTIGTKKTDAADVKRIRNANLYLRGLRMMPTADGESRQSVAATGIHVDKAVLDEVDQMEEEIIGKVRGRLSNARIDGIRGKSQIVYIGNPSDEDRGIDSLWQQSDQRYWFRKCDCGGWTCAEIEFFEDPEKCVGLYPDKLARLDNHLPTGYIRCVKCGKPVGQRRGKWIATKPENRRRHGFNWSYLTSENQDPAHVLHCFRYPPENNVGDVIRLMLGRAYSSADEKLRKEAVYSCCSNDGMPDSHNGPCAMGADNDDGKHIVIGIRTGQDRFKVIRVFVLDDVNQNRFGQMLDLIQRYRVKSCVTDLRPNADAAREFQKAAVRYGCRVYLCEYTESPLQDFNFIDQTGIVKVYRTGIFDTTHRVIVNNQIVLPRRSRLIDDFAQQCCNCVKHKEIDKRKRIVVYRYKKTGNGNDHFRNALNYFLVASMKIGRSKDTRFDVPTRDCIMDYTGVY